VHVVRSQRQVFLSDGEFLTEDTIMRYLHTMFAACTLLCATDAILGANDAIAQDGSPCQTAGAIYTIGGKKYKCVPSYGQAHNPNWDGRSKQPTTPAMMGQPSGISTQQAVFPGIKPSEYEKLQNSADGKALIKQADDLRAAQAQAQKEYDNIKSTGTGAQLTAADQKLKVIGNDIQKLQPQAEKILVQLH
jgi:hypothetical protein